MGILSKTVSKIKRFVSRKGPRIKVEKLRALADARGFDLVLRHYYSPVPQREDLEKKGFWQEVSGLRGLEMGDDCALNFLHNRLPPYLKEFRERFLVEKTEGSEAFHLINGVYMAVDAHVYYGMIRDLKPNRLIEIGSGQSTRVAVEAVRQNVDDGGNKTEIISIEPFPSDLLLGLDSDSHITLLQKRVQDVPISEFESLQSGDVLFIDSTHVLREGSDVLLEYLEILPVLQPGVHVHIHDICLPRRYPKVYYDQGIYWNEQYLLQAFLCFNDAYEVVWPGNYMLFHYPELIHKVFPEIEMMRRVYPLSEPSAFWMRRKANDRKVKSG